MNLRTLARVPQKIQMICMGGIVTPGYIASTIADRHCDIIRGDVVVRNWRGDATPLQHLMTIRKIKGVLHIIDNEELKDLCFLSGLKEIQADSKEQRAALVISNNTALEELLLISLTRLESPALVTVVIKNNPKLFVDVEEMYEVAGGQNRTTLVLANIARDGYDWEDSVPLFAKISVGVTLVVALVLTVLWCTYGTRWKKFSGLSTAIPPTPSKKTRVPKR
ncbi:hypothetical protein Y032_0188g1158 [Ancylostoma ceylanicum]|uniref:Receptor L-domain domain-containing protein n=1 Tax=Ancylostoma ceylanicum TaxID=53326 RepID=A0A016SQX3_9BILA|nr:hypothetical protein Y032_0188g1158 [Ancylostoma ceylanicum]